jgi:hypothetical protein
LEDRTGREEQEGEGEALAFSSTDNELLKVQADSYSTLAEVQHWTWHPDVCNIHLLDERVGIND